MGKICVGSHRMFACAASMIHVYAASNAQPQRGENIRNTKSFDGASEASGVFISNVTNFDGASEAS